MIGQVRARLSFANVVSLVALFVALGGVAYALESNSVKSRHIVDGQVKSVDLKDNSITSGDIASGALSGASITTGGNGFVGFNAPSIPAGSCTGNSLGDLPGAPDLLLVQPSNPTADYDVGGGLIVTGMMNGPGQAHGAIKVCNVTNGAIDPPNLFFVVLPIAIT